MRLIDADQLTDVINRSYLTKGEKRLFNIKIRHAPTVDTGDAKYLEERDADAFESGYIQGLSKITKGEWLCDDKYLDCRCSICNSYALERGDYPELSPYCPQCGARMEVITND